MFMVLVKLNHDVCISYLSTTVRTVPEKTGYKKTELFWLTVSKALAHRGEKAQTNSTW